MRARFIGAAATLSLLASLAVVQTVLGQSGPAERRAAAGQAASGQVISEANGVLRLNTTPCRDAATVVVFQRPYAKEPAGTVTCRGAARALVQVLQR